MTQQKNYLLKELLEARMVSGPLNKTINNSGLGVIKRVLCGLPPFLGGERYLLYGTELHQRALMRKKGSWTPFDIDEEHAMIFGVKALYKDKIFLDNYKGAIIETKIKKLNAFGIHGMHGTLDIHNKRKKRVVDLKTTSATTEKEFIDKAIKLSYPRQGVCYEEFSGATETIFIGISKKNISEDPKKPDYPIFHFHLNDFKDEKQKATEEAKFLLTFYKEYGLPIDKYVKQDNLIGADL